MKYQIRVDDWIELIALDWTRRIAGLVVELDDTFIVISTRDKDLMAIRWSDIRFSWKR